MNPNNSYKDLKLMILLAKTQAKLHNCNYNVIIHNHVNGKFDFIESTYEMVANSYFEKERPNVILLHKTDDLIKEENELVENIKSVLHETPILKSTNFKIFDDKVKGYANGEIYLQKGSNNRKTGFFK